MQLITRTVYNYMYVIYVLDNHGLLYLVMFLVNECILYLCMYLSRCYSNLCFYSYDFYSLPRNYGYLALSN